MKIIYPWKAGQLDAPKSVKTEIIQELNARYPGVLGSKIPDDTVQHALKSVCSTLIELEKSHSVPWVVVTTQHLSLVHTLARMIPVTMALTRHWRPLNITTDVLVDTFRQPAPFDDFSPDPAGELLHSVKNRGILVWENFSELKLGGYKYASQFMEVLGHRMDKRKMTVFLCPLPRGMSPTELTALLDRVEKSIGANAPNILREAATWKHFKTASNTQFNVKTEEV
jgi:hypothetical protein